MPAEDGLGGDEERHPPLAWHGLGQGGDDRLIRPGETGSGDLTSEHGELEAEHQDLRVVGAGIHPEDSEQFDNAARQTVEEAECDERGASLRLSWLVKLAIE